MLLFYVDESGTGLKDKRSPFFVLAAIGVPAEQALFLDNSLLELKRRLVDWVPPEDFEIKGRDLRRGERLLKGIDWGRRVGMMQRVADWIMAAPTQLMVVQIDKRELPDSVETEDQLYRLALWRLLNEIERLLEGAYSSGMLMLDARSDLHRSIQDRRTVDAFRQWRSGRPSTRLVELPWFGFSAFYSGLQIADFVAYLFDAVHNDAATVMGAVSVRADERADDLADIWRRFAGRLQIVRIP